MTTMRKHFHADVTGWKVAAGVALSIAGIVILVLAIAALASAEDVALRAVRPTLAEELPNIAWITADELARKLDGPPNERPVLLDTRTEAEFAVSHLKGAQRVDPDHPNVAAVAFAHDRFVVVYCSVGYRSGHVADVLTRAGFRDVRNLEGGIFGWANAGRPVYRGDVVVRDVHPYDDVWGRLLRPDLRTRVPR